MEAAKRLQALDIDFVAAGSPDPGNPAAVPMDKLREWETQGLVRFPGHVKDIPKLLAEADIFVLPSYREGLPKSLIEAAACGLSAHRDRRSRLPGNAMTDGLELGCSFRRATRPRLPTLSGSWSKTRISRRHWEPTPGKSGGSLRRETHCRQDAGRLSRVHSLSPKPQPNLRRSSRDLRPCAFRGRLCVLRKPGLRHQNGPQPRAPVTPFAQVLAPGVAHKPRIEVTLTRKPGLIEQVFRPIAQRSAKPLAYRDREARFRPLNQLARHIAVQHLPQRPFGLAVWNSMSSGRRQPTEKTR